MSTSLNGRRHFWNFSVSELTVSNNEDGGGKKYSTPPFNGVVFCILCKGCGQSLICLFGSHTAREVIDSI